MWYQPLDELHPLAEDLPDAGKMATDNSLSSV
jgi:hypothetical protein